MFFPCVESNEMSFSVLSTSGGRTCNAAYFWQTHHDLGEAFGLVGVFKLGVVLAHIPVALVQLLELGDVGQSSDV